MVRIADYLDQLLLDFIALKDLAVEAIERAPVFSAPPNIEDAADEYVTTDCAFQLKVLWLRIPKTLERSSRNYYYVPDHWRECKITIPYEVNSTTGEMKLNGSLYEDWCRIETEIEADLWRVRNQPGYLTTPAKLALLEHAIFSGVVPVDEAQQPNRFEEPKLLTSLKVRPILWSPRQLTWGPMEVSTTLTSRSFRPPQLEPGLPGSR